MISKSPALFVGAADDVLLDDMGAVAELGARHVVEMPDLRADVHLWIDRAFEHAADMSVGEALGLQRIAVRLPIDALAEATWPAFTALLGSPQAQHWMDSLLEEVLDEHERIARASRTRSARPSDVSAPAASAFPWPGRP